jgi:hypothetical protein
LDHPSLLQQAEALATLLPLPGRLLLLTQQFSQGWHLQNLGAYQQQQRRQGWYRWSCAGPACRQWSCHGLHRVQL